MMDAQRIEAIARAVVDRVATQIDAHITKRLAELELKTGPQGEPGPGLRDAFQDAEHRLVLTFEDGRTKDVGPVRGKDGNDGLGIDDLHAELEDGGRWLCLKFSGNGREKVFRLKTSSTIYRGTYDAARKYLAGDQCSFGGSVWTALEDTETKPGDSGSDWQLSAKHGRDGKSANMSDIRKMVGEALAQTKGKQDG